MSSSTTAWPIASIVKALALWPQIVRGELNAAATKLNVRPAPPKPPKPPKAPRPVPPDAGAEAPPTTDGSAA